MQQWGFHSLVQFGTPSRYVDSSHKGILFKVMGPGRISGSLCCSIPKSPSKKIGWESQDLNLKETGPKKGYWDRNIRTR